MVKLIAAVLVSAFISNASAQGRDQEAAGGICTSLRNAATELAEQLPMRLDSVTTLSSVSAIFLAGRCQVTYVYLLKEERFLDIVSGSVARHSVDALNSSREGIIEYVNSEEGRQRYRKTIISGLPEDARRLAGIPYIDVVARHIFDGGRILPVEVFVE